MELNDLGDLARERYGLFCRDESSKLETIERVPENIEYLKITLNDKINDELL